MVAGGFSASHRQGRELLATAHERIGEPILVEEPPREPRLQIGNDIFFIDRMAILEIGAVEKDVVGDRACVAADEDVKLPGVPVLGVSRREGVGADRRSEIAQRE